MPEKMFVTCLYGVLDPATGHLRFANAGHDVPYVRTADGVSELRARGMPLGLMPGMDYEEKEMNLQPGDSVLLHSDGIVEAHDAERNMYGFPRLKETVAEASGSQELIDAVLSDLASFAGATTEQEDDITMVAIERSGDSAASTTEQNGHVLAEFELPSEPGGEREAITRVNAATAEAGLTARQRDRLETAVGEATMNAMEHGNGYDAELPVTIRVSSLPGRLVVEVSDAGRSGAIGEAEAPDIDAKLEGRQSPRGWGLFLIESMVDEVQMRGDERGQTLELTVRLEGDTDGYT
jgi:anti-sigma regulatory factor (Ser/Thr protein kinase)